jgi:hypothetical protein
MPCIVIASIAGNVTRCQAAAVAIVAATILMSLSLVITRLCGFLGTMRGITVSGLENVCPQKLNGKRRHAAQMDRSFLGEMFLMLAMPTRKIGAVSESPRLEIT